MPEAAHAGALEGIGALERLPANDPALGRFTPFRLDMWTFFAQRFTAGTPDKAAYARVLGAARQRIQQQPDERLGTMAQDAHLQFVLTEMAKGAAMVRSVLRLPPGAPMRDQDKARVLWASAPAARMLGGMSHAELESLGRAVLHLPGTVRWDRSRGQALAALVAAANTEGLDTADRDVLGAFHLKWNVAFSSSVLLSRNGDTQGVNWSGRPSPGGVNAGRVRVIGAAGDVQTVVAP